MRRRIYAFWMYEDKERGKAMGVAAAAILIYGLICNTVLQRNLTEVSREALVFPFLILIFWPIAKDVSLRIRTGSLLNRVMVSLGLSAFIVLVPICLSAYVQKRLNSIAKLPPKEFQNNLAVSARTIAAASISGIKVPQG